MAENDGHEAQERGDHEHGQQGLAGYPDGDEGIFRDTEIGWAE